MSEEIRNLLEGLPFWKYLKEEEKRQLEEASREVHYPAGAGVYSGAGECLGAIYILNGIFRTYLLSDEGKEVTMFRLRQGDTCILSASCVLPAITFDVEIEAQTDVEALLIPVGTLSKITKKNVYAENFVYKEAAKRFSDVVEALQQIMFLSLTQRVAAFLLDAIRHRAVQTRADRIPYMVRDFFPAIFKDRSYLQVESVVFVKHFPVL